MYFFSHRKYPVTSSGVSRTCSSRKYASSHLGFRPLEWRSREPLHLSNCQSLCEYFSNFGRLTNIVPKTFNTCITIQPKNIVFRVITELNEKLTVYRLKYKGLEKGTIRDNFHLSNLPHSFWEDVPGQWIIYKQLILEKVVRGFEIQVWNIVGSVKWDVGFNGSFVCFSMFIVGRLFKQCLTLQPSVDP